MTIIVAVSLQLPFVHTKLYVPAALKFAMEVVAEVLAVIVAVPAFPAAAVQVPEPVAAMFAMPPGSMAQVTV